MKNYLKIWSIPLVVLIILTLVIKIALAPFFGYVFDLNCFREWTAALLAVKNFSDLANLYFNPPPLTGYPVLPVALYFFGLFSLLYKLLISNDLSTLTPVLNLFLKLPSIIADFLIATVIFKIVAKNFSLKSAYSIGLALLLNPSIIFVSSIWGQIDSLGFLFVLLSIYFLAEKKYRLSWLFIGIAVLTKVQSVFFAPLIFMANFWNNKFKTALQNIILGIVGSLFIILPFNKAVPKIISILLAGPGFYPKLSVFAFNFWQIPQWFNKLIILSDQDLYLLIGLSFFSLFYFIILKKILKCFTPFNIFFAAALIGFAAFLFLTEMHERYLFPAVALLSILPAWRMRYWLNYIVISICYLVNLIASATSSNLLWRLSIVFIILNLLNFFYLFYEFVKKKNSDCPTHLQ